MSGWLCITAVCTLGSIRETKVLCWRWARWTPWVWTSCRRLSSEWWARLRENWGHFQLGVDCHVPQYIPMTLGPKLKKHWSYFLVSFSWLSKLKAESTKGELKERVPGSESMRAEDFMNGGGGGGGGGDEKRHLVVCVIKLLIIPSAYNRFG